MTPLVNQTIQFVARFDDLGEWGTPGSSSGVTNPTKTLVTLESAGEAWLGGQTQGIRLAGDYPSGTTGSAFIQASSTSFLDTFRANIGSNDRFALVAEYAGATDDDAHEEFAPRMTFLNPGFADEVYFGSMANRRKKDPLMFFPFQANNANMVTPNHTSNVMTIENTAVDWASGPSGGMLMYNLGSGSGPAMTDEGITLIGIVKLLDPTPVFSLSFDDNSRDVLTVWLPLLEANDIPFGMFIETSKLEGQENYIDGTYLSDADFATLLAAKRADGVTNLFTPMYHSNDHTTLAGYQSTDISFTAPSTITFPSGAAARFRTDQKLVVKSPGSPNDGLVLTQSSNSGTVIVCNEATITTEAARTDNVKVWIDADDAERRANIEDGLPLYYNLLGNRAHKMFAHPFGAQCDASIAILKEHGFVINRGTDDLDNGSYFQNFINHDGTVNNPMNLKLLGDLGRTINTVAEFSQRMNILEYVGGWGNIYGHSATDGSTSVDIDATEVPGIVSDIAARVTAGTIKAMGWDEVAVANFGEPTSGFVVGNWNEESFTKVSPANKVTANGNNQ